MSAATIASPLDCQSVYLSVCLCVCLLAFLSICLSIFLSIFLSVCPSVCLCICVFVCLCICVCVSICPSYGIQHSFSSCRHLHSLFRHLLALSPSSDILHCIVLYCAVLYCTVLIEGESMGGIRRVRTGSFVPPYASPLLP